MIFHMCQICWKFLEFSSILTFSPLSQSWTTVDKESTFPRQQRFHQMSLFLSCDFLASVLVEEKYMLHVLGFRNAHWNFFDVIMYVIFVLRLRIRTPIPNDVKINKILLGVCLFIYSFKNLYININLLYLVAEAYEISSQKIKKIWVIYKVLNGNVYKEVKVCCPTTFVPIWLFSDGCPIMNTPIPININLDVNNATKLLHLLLFTFLINVILCIYIYILMYYYMYIYISY